MAEELLNLTAYELAEKIEAREVSALEAAEVANARVEETENDVRAFDTVTPELALDRAERVDARMKNGGVKFWEGVPIAVKDVLSTRGVRTTCGSKILENFEPLYDPSALLNYGEDMVVVGKTNCDEFAIGSSTENSAYGPSRNPWDLNLVPGGSSGGSAVAAAAGEGWWSLGTDTGGSTRQPASLCGIVGMKPSYGRVSRYGLIAFASSLDQLGPLTADVADCALISEVISGHDPLDSTSLDEPVPHYLDALTGDLRGVRLGVPKEYFVDGMEPGVAASIQAAIDTLRGLGAEIGEVSLPHSDYGLAAYYIIAPAECSANLARYDGVKYGYSAPDAETMWDGYYKTRGRGFGEEVKRRIMLGTYALSSGYYDAFYVKAQKIRTLIKQDFDQAFERFDALLAPTSPTVAFEIGAKTDDPLAMYLNDVCTIPVNLAGLPGISVPCGVSEGLPVGLQVIGKALGEAIVLRVAHAFEQARGGPIARPE